MSRVVVVLGAGASYDVANGGVRVLDAAWRPPLAAELFDGSRFEGILRSYRGAQQLAPSVAELSSEGLEAALARYARGNELQRSLFRDIPPYLRDVLYACSHSYVSHPGSYAALVNKLIVDGAHEVMFALLNYDDLLEQALRAVSPRTYPFDSVSLDSLDSYVVPSRQANVVKLHGSIDWFRSIGLTSSGDWLGAVEETDVLSPAEQLVRLDVGPAVRNAQHKSRWLYPVLTAPLANKTEADLVCSAHHRAELRSFMASASKFLFVGTSGLDDDLCGLLAATMPQIGQAMIVGPDRKKTAATMDNLQRRIPQLRGYAQFGEDFLVAFTEGFRALPAAPQLDRFLAFSL